MGKNDKIKNAVKEFFMSYGFTQDRYGNLKSQSGNYRVKFNPNKYRFERKCIDRWIRQKSEFYKDIEVLS